MCFSAPPSDLRVFEQFEDSKIRGFPLYRFERATINGKFSPRQREIYEACNAVSKACLLFYKPGISAYEVGAAVRKKLQQEGYDLTSNAFTRLRYFKEGGVTHHVGLATHDAGGSDKPKDQPLQTGEVIASDVFAVFPDENLGVRVENVVLITETGCENLSPGLPREISEIEALRGTVRLKPGTPQEDPVLSIEDKYDEVRELNFVGKERGYLLYDEVNDLLPEGVCSSDEPDSVFHLLDSAGMELIDTEQEFQDGWNRDDKGDGNNGKDGNIDYKLLCRQEQADFGNPSSIKPGADAAIRPFQADSAFPI